MHARREFSLLLNVNAVIIKNLLAQEERKDTDTNEHQIHDTR